MVGKSKCMRIEWTGQKWLINEKGKKNTKQKTKIYNKSKGIRILVYRMPAYVCNGSNYPRALCFHNVCFLHRCTYHLHFPTYQLHRSSDELAQYLERTRISNTYHIEIDGDFVSEFCMIHAHFHYIDSLILHWRHNGLDGISNHQPHDCLLNRLFRHR